MRWLKCLGFVLLFVAITAGCGKDEKSDQEVQKALKEATKKEQQLYEGMQKGIQDIEKSVQGQQKGNSK